MKGLGGGGGGNQRGGEGLLTDDTLGRFSTDPKLALGA